MKKLLCLIIFFFGSIAASGQCVDRPNDPCVLVNQTVIDRASAAVTELVAARDVIVKFQNERLATDAEREAAKTLVKSLNDVLDVRGRIIAEYDRMAVVYQKVIDMQTALIDRLTREINKPKSSWQKLASALKTVMVLATGITLGRGL